MSTNGPTLPNRSDCEAGDAADPLAAFRDRFVLEDGVIYLDGNSLGALPKATAGRLAAVVEEEWGRGLIRSWNTAGWMDQPRRVGDKIAALIGARPGEVVAADSTSVNIFKALTAALQLNPGRRVLLSERGSFPTDIYMMQGLEILLDGRVEARFVDAGEIGAALDGDVAALLLTHVHYKTGRAWDMAALTRAAQDAGALVIWDLSHSAGALPVDLNGAGADFAVGCGYKYLNGGPGAPAYIFVAERHQAGAPPALAGWMGHAAPFEFDDRYWPSAGIERYRCGTPAVLGMAALEAGVDLLAEADMAALREKSCRLGDLFLSLTEALCPDQGFAVACPTDAAVRGSQVSLHHEHGYAIMQALIDARVIGDFRAPDILRFGFAPLYVRYVDVYDAVATLAEIMRNRAWDRPEFQVRAAVT